MVDVASSASLLAQYPGNVAAFRAMTYNWTKRAVQPQVSAVNIWKCVSAKKIMWKTTFYLESVKLLLASA